MTGRRKPIAPSELRGSLTKINYVHIFGECLMRQLIRRLEMVYNSLFPVIEPVSNFWIREWEPK